MRSNQGYTGVVEIARDYYNSEDADNFYFHIWGGEDIHVGLYEHDDEEIPAASKRTVERLAQQIPDLDESTRILDIGAGYGGAARHLARTYGCHVTALNLSEKENERNREQNLITNLRDHIDVIDASFEELPFDDASFDVVWSQDAILHSGRRKKVMREVFRVLKPGGDFVFTDPMQADDCPPDVLKPVLERIHLESLGSFAYYKDTAADIGFECVEIIDMTEQLPRHYARVSSELTAHRSDLEGKVSDEYIDRMLNGLKNWVDAGNKGYLAWGIMHFRKPRKKKA